MPAYRLRDLLAECVAAVPSGDGYEDDRAIMDEIGDQDRGHNVLVGLGDPILVERLIEHARWIHRGQCSTV